MSNSTDSSNAAATQPDFEFDFPEILYNFDDVLQDMLSNTLPLKDVDINGKIPQRYELQTLGTKEIDADVLGDMYDAKNNMSCDNTEAELQDTPDAIDPPSHNYDAYTPAIGYPGHEASYETSYDNTQTGTLPDTSPFHQPIGTISTGDRLIRQQCPVGAIDETSYPKSVDPQCPNLDAAQLTTQHIAIQFASQGAQESTSARLLQAQHVPDLQSPACQPFVQPETQSEAQCGEFPEYQYPNQDELSRYGHFEVPSNLPTQNNVPCNPAQTLTESPLPSLVFEDLAHAEETMFHRYISKDWRSPVQDVTVPKTKHARAQSVMKLLDAMQDTTQCKDQQGPPAFKNRWAADAIHKPDPAHMEKVCWKLVDIAERLHAYGPSSLSIYDNETLQIAYKSRDLTFEERIDNICALLRLSKSRCFSLLKNENLETTVSAPAQRIAGLKTNFTQNGRRQKYLVAGRSLVKKDECNNATKDTAYFGAAPGDQKDNMVGNTIQAELVRIPPTQAGNYMHQSSHVDMHESNDISHNTRNQTTEHPRSVTREPVFARRKRGAEEAHLDVDIYRNQRQRIDMR